MKALTNKIPCDYCNREIIIPEYPTDEGVQIHMNMDEESIFVVLLCLSCGGLNDLYYEFRESQCEAYVTKEPPWKDDEEYKEAMLSDDMLQFILFNREIGEGGLLG